MRGYQHRGMDVDTRLRRMRADPSETRTSYSHCAVY